MRLIVMILISAIMFRCSTPQIAVAPSLMENTTFYEARGKNGWQIGQEISFGEFKTGKIKRGWTFSYNIPFILKFQGAREKMEFEQLDGSGNTAMIYTVNKFKSTELSLVDDYFHIPIKQKDYFAGTISLSPGREIWDFIIYNPDGETIKNTTKGYLRYGSEEITIEGIQHLAGKKVQLNDKTYGYHFILHGKAVAAVSTVNNGSVWFRNDLTASQKLLFASLSSALMARYNMEEAAEGDFL